MSTLFFENRKSEEERSFDNVISITACNGDKKEVFSSPEALCHARQRLSGYNFDVYCEDGKTNFLSSNWIPSGCR